MGTLKIIKKHHKHLNNPFPSPPKSRPSIEGSLLFNSETLQFHQIFQLGTHFHLLWTTLHGGYISISHHSNPSKSLWSTIPGQAFVSAGAIETEVEESRGSFVINDLKALLVCDHQIIEDIRVIHNQDSFFESGFSPFDQKIDTQFPALIITGILFSKSESGIPKAINLEKIKESSSFSRYWVLFDQKKDKQIGFRVKLGHPELEIQPKTSLTRLGKYQRLRKKIRRIGKRKLGFGRWFRRPRGFIKVCSSEERESLRIQ